MLEVIATNINQLTHIRILLRTMYAWLPCAHTHIHTRTHKHTQRHTHTHKDTHTHTHKDTHTHKHTYIMYTYACTQCF